MNNKIRASHQSNWATDLLGLAIFLGVFYALWIGSYALFTPDEGRYSEVAREMVATSDYITPRLNGVAFLDKPALYYWLQAAAIQLFGLKEWALRFWPATLGLLSALVTYLTGRLLFTRRTGIISAIILATSPLYYGAAHYANLDLEVASLIGDSLLCFIAAMQQSAARLRSILLFAAYFFAGLAALTKGLIGIVFPAMIIGAWILLLNRWAILKKMHLFSGLLLFACIVLPWYVLVQKANPEFLHFFFVTQQVSRFLTTQDFNSKAAIWFYVPVVLAGFFPWSIFLIQAVSQNIKSIWQNRQHHAVELFLLLWLVMVFVFFSIPRSKTVGYILPIFPVMALLVGHYVSQLWTKPKAFGVTAGVLLFVVASDIVAVIFLIAPYFNQIFEFPVPFIIYLRYMAVTLLLASIVICYAARKASLAPVFVALTATVMALLLIFISAADALNEKSVKPLVLELNTYLKPGDEVAAYYKYYQDLPIYLQRRVTMVADWHASDIPNNDNWIREIWYGMVFQDTKDWLIEADTFQKRWHSARRMYVFTSEGYYLDLAAKMKVYKVSEHNNIFLLTNHPLH